MTEETKEQLINMLEMDSQVTLKQMKERLRLSCSEMTISRAIHGMGFTVKKVHQEPIGMNSLENRIKRKDYVERLQILMEESTTFKNLIHITFEILI